MATLRILIADELTLVRAGMRALLARISGVEVVAEASNGEEALQMAHANSPDAVLAAISLPGINGIELTARIAASLPKVRVVIVSRHAGEEYVSRALRSGAAAYVLKTASAGELEQAIRAVTSGRTYLSPSIAKGPGDYERLMRHEHDPLHKLTSRHQEVLRLVGEGRSTMQIAGDLGISHKTVETHRAQIMARIGVDDVTGMVRYAIRAGLIQIDRP